MNYGVKFLSGGADAMNAKARLKGMDFSEHDYDDKNYKESIDKYL